MTDLRPVGHDRATLRRFCMLAVLITLAMPNLSAVASRPQSSTGSPKIMEMDLGSIEGLGPKPMFAGNLSGNWEQYNHPSELTFAVMAFDHMHREAYIFGGKVGAGMNNPCKDNLWKYNLEKKQWTDMSTGFRPSCLVSASMVYDHEGQSLYLFGGENEQAWMMNDLWQYNISNRSWQNVPDGSAPPIRKLAGFAMDSIHRTLYVYGGLSNKDFWRYDIGSREWTDLTTQTTPSDGGSSMLFFDEVTQNLILLSMKQWKYDVNSGDWTIVNANAQKYYNGSQAAFDPVSRKIYSLSFHPKYSYDINTGNVDNGIWSTLNSSTPLINATYGRMVFDSVGNGLFFYGSSEPTPNYFYYDIASDRFTDLGCQCNPGTRDRDNMVYNPFNGTLIMLGGSSNNDARTWEWNISTHSWHVFNPTPAGGNRFQYPMEMATGTKEVYVYRGSGADVSLMKYNVTTHTWVGPTTSGTSPNNKYRMGMAYVPTNGSLYLFGGTNGGSTYYHNLYRYNISTSTWSDISQGVPNNEANPAMVYMRSSNSIYMFGGAESDITFSKIMYKYNITTATWTNLNSGVGTAPKNQSYSNIFYRSKDDSIYVFGGMSRTSTSNPYFHHPGFWAFNLSTNTWRLENDVMVTSDWANQRVAYNESSDTIYLFGAKNSVWTGSFDQKHDMSITAAGFVRTDGAAPSGLLHILYPGIMSSVMVEVNDTKGSGNVNQVELTLDPAGTALTFRWDRNAGTFSQISGQNGIVSIDPSSSYLDMSSGRLRVWFNLTPAWGYPDTAAHGLSVKASNADGKVRTKAITVGYMMTKALELKGGLEAQGDIHGKLVKGGWVIAGEGINWTGPRLVHKGTTLTPLFEVGTVVKFVLNDNDGESWTSTAPLSEPIKIRSKADAAEDLSEEYVLDATGLPQGLTVTNKSFAVHVDGDPVRFLGSTPKNASWFLSPNIETTIDLDDLLGSGVDIDSIQLRTSGDGALSWSDWKAPRKVVEWSSCMTAYADVELKEGTGNRVQWRARDMIGNPFAYSTTLYSYLDTGKVRFFDQSPEPELPVKTIDESVVNISIAAKDDVSGVALDSVQYSVSFDGGSTWASWSAPDGRTTDAGGAVRAWASVDLLDNLEMSAKWRAKDRAGNTYNESPISEVKKHVSTVTSEVYVTLVGPANGTMVRSAPLTLSWNYKFTNSSHDPNPSQISYSVFFSTDSSMVGGHREEALIANNTKGTNLTINASSVKMGARYYWTVLPIYIGRIGTCAQGTWNLRMNNVPTIERIPDQWVMVPHSVDIPLNASDPDGDIVVLNLTRGPTGMAVAGSRLIWAPTIGEAGNHEVEVTASDGDLQAKVHFNLNVLVPQPMVSIISPTNNSLLRGDLTVDISYSIASPGDKVVLFQSVEFRLDNGKWVSALSKGGDLWRGVIPSANISNGNHVITARGWAGPVSSKEVSVGFLYDATVISEPPVKTNRVDLSSYMMVLGISVGFFVGALALFLFLELKERRSSRVGKDGKRKKKSKGGPGSSGGGGPDHQPSTGPPAVPSMDQPQIPNPDPQSEVPRPVHPNDVIEGSRPEVNDP